MWIYSWELNPIQALADAFLLTYKEICSLAQSSKLPEFFTAPLGIFLSCKFSVTFLFEIFWLSKTQCVYGLLLQLNLQDSRSAQLFSNSFSFAANVTLNSVFGQTWKSVGKGAMYRTVAGSSFSRGVVEAKQLLVATGTVRCCSTCGASSATLNSKACPKSSRSNILLGRKNGAIFKAQGWETRLVKPELWESRYLKALRFLACKLAKICKGCSKDLWSVCKVLSDPWVESAVRVQTSCSDITQNHC